MDPNAALREIRAELAAHDSERPVDLDRLVEHVRALDEWICQGGFLPEQWDIARLLRPADATRTHVINTQRFAASRELGQNGGQA